jgi:ABC-type multidrug transport system ATPase subunit
MDQGPELGIVSEFYSANAFLNGPQNAQAFSALSINNREGQVVDAMKEEFSPLISELVVLSATQIPGIYAVVPGFREKVPLALLSSGVNKLFTILSAMILRGDGVVLLDEIDNGFYYDRLETIWRLIYRLSIKHNTQVFASTHSQECLKALAKVVKGNETDFNLLHAERDKDGISVTQVEGEFFEDAIEQGFEVR